MKTEKAVKSPVAVPVKLDKQVFEGTVAGHKFLFLAGSPTLEKVAEVPAGKSAAEIALQNSAELVARAQANHEAVKSLYRSWVQAKKAERAASPEAIAAKAEKDAAKARAKADRIAERDEARKAKAQQKLEAKAEAARLAALNAKAAK